MVGKPLELLDCVRSREYGEVRCTNCGCCCCSSLADIVRYDLLICPIEINISMIVHRLLMCYDFFLLRVGFLDGVSDMKVGASDDSIEDD